ncbi:MAG: WGR domain-containing protein [Candidatus Thorarchaeota archaeon]
MSSKEYKTGRYENQNADTGVPEFWQAERVYRTVTIIFGKIGSKGTRASRDFSSSTEAQQFIETRLKEKIEEGFVRTD